MLRVMTDYSLTAHTHFLLSLFLFVGFVCEKARGNFPTWPICSEKVFCRDVISYAPKPFYLFLSKHERLFLSFQVIRPGFQTAALHVGVTAFAVSSTFRSLYVFESTTGTRLCL